MFYFDLFYPLDRARFEKDSTFKDNATFVTAFGSLNEWLCLNIRTGVRSFESLTCFMLSCLLRGIGGGQSPRVGWIDK